MADASTLRQLLAPTSVPAALVEEVLDAGPAWLMGASDEVVAAEVVLCHPPLAGGEVRAVATPGTGGRARLTVVAADRPGLLADTAGVLASEGASITDATTAVLAGSRLALQRIEVGGRHLGDADWERIGARLREVHAAGTEPLTRWRPAPPVTVETQPQGGERSVVTLHAPDRPGLLHAAAAWLVAAGCNVEACHATSERGMALDVFVVTGEPDPAAFAEALGGSGSQTGHGGFFVVRLAAGLALLPWRFTAGVLRELGRQNSR